MAREHARVKLSIWEDEDFRALSPAAQHLYFVLMTSPKLDYAGVTDWRPARLAQYAGGWSTYAVEVAAQELSEQLYLIIDTESEEVLIRSFIRSDGLLQQPNLAISVRKAHASIASAALRAIVIHELVRLHADKPELKGWSQLVELLEKPSLDPSDHPSFQVSPDPSPDPSGGHVVIPSVHPSPKGCLTTSPATATTPSSPDGEKPEARLSGERHVPIRPRDARCPPHRGVAIPGPCPDCRAAREQAERAEAAAKRAASNARRNCTECDDAGMVLDPETSKPIRKCTAHSRRSA